MAVKQTAGREALGEFATLKMQMRISMKNTNAVRTEIHYA